MIAECPLPPMFRMRKPELREVKTFAQGIWLGSWTPTFCPQSPSWRECTLTPDRWPVTRPDPSFALKPLAVACHFRSAPETVSSCLEPSLFEHIPNFIPTQISYYVRVCVFNNDKALICHIWQEGFFISTLKHYWEIISATRVKNNGTPSEKTVSETLRS